MPLIVYLDETGNPSLELEDPSFPVFAVVLLVCDIHEYTERIVPAFYRLKFKHFGHEGVVLHSRDIRKAQGDFGFLTNPAKRQEFMGDLTGIMTNLNYRCIASVIRKQQHKERYGIFADDPYELALKFNLERLLGLLEEEGERRVTVVAEARGKREDKNLQASFWFTVNAGTYYCAPSRFKSIDFDLRFIPKTMNVVGNQMADLAAYPIARHVIDPDKPNPAYDVIKCKVWNLKTFP